MVFNLLCCHCWCKLTTRILVIAKRCQKIMLIDFIERDGQKKCVQIVIYKRLTKLVILGLWSVFVVVMLQLNFAQHV